MNRLRAELVPAIGSQLANVGVSTLVCGAHSLRRMAEHLVWGGPNRPSHHGACGCACSQVQHHYRVSCRPRCYDGHR